MATTREKQRKLPALNQNFLKPQDVVTILKAAHEASVSEIRYADLHITFGRKPNVESEPMEMVLERKEVTKTLDEKKMEVLDELLITNPLEYETQLARLQAEDNE